jgi:hypothetical protein
VVEWAARLAQKRDFDVGAEMFTEVASVVDDIYRHGIPAVPA